MNPDQPLTLLGGLTPAQFMKTYWQKKPLLIRQAIPGFKSPISVAALKKLSKQDDIESRLIQREKDQWEMDCGPFSRLPKASTPDWTLLVQSVDIHDDAACILMNQFRFVPDARLDDLMISLATVGGGVGPHFDCYHVFFVQAHGRRRWQFGQQSDLSLIDGLPLKILSDFAPEQEFILEPGDMLYLPPQAAHDGVALDECMTISIGFRAPDEAALARGMLEAAADQIVARAGLASGPYGEPPLPGPKLDALYRDPKQAATQHPAEIPEGLIQTAVKAVSKIKFNEALAHRFLGCWLTEPNQAAVFDQYEDQDDEETEDEPYTHWALDRRTRMLYRGKQLFINGEVAAVEAEAGLKILADARELAGSNPAAKKFSQDAVEALADWLDAGWIHLVRK
jgi:50S ribosomal protein L16 3-hydroxylase